jgi:Tfp pilus assembly protein PilV
MARRVDRSLRSQGGFGLIEVIITVALAGMVILGLAAGLLALVRSQDATEQRQVIAQALGNMSEGIKALPYVPCSPGAGPDAAAVKAAYLASSTNWLPPAGMTAEPTSVRYWDRASRTFVEECPGEDQGAQMVTLAVEWRGRGGSAQVVVGAP